jgi:4-hydroxythreonine-4-phosphate dehydrogenase
MKKPHVVISLGDFNGIGYEIALKSMLQKSVRSLAEYTLVGSFEALAAWKKALGITMPLNFIEVAPKQSVHVTPGKITASAGAVAARSIEIAAKMCIRGEANVLVTAPIAKESFHKAGIEFPGHTEMLQSLTKSKRVTMILLSERMRVALVTIHRALRTVPGVLSKNDILTKLGDLNDTLRIDFATPKPRIAVLGLNPHASENGMFGDEEKRIISPAIIAARKKKILAEGPFPADGFFARWTPLKYDAILAMYHDQGLIPLKMDARGGGVNFSANLPIVRTSPDHGTAFDIAGKNRANESSFIEAIKVGLQIAHNRKAHGR